MNPLFETIIEQSKTKKTEKQQKVIETAITLFAEKGYSNTSTAEIAKQAGVSEGTIFKHYGSKEKLLLSIIIPFIKDFLPIIAKEDIDKRLNEASNVEQFLRKLIRDRAEFIQDNLEIFQVIIKELIYQDELKKELVSYISGNIVPLVEPIVSKFKEQGEIPDIPTERILRLVFTVLSGLFVTRFVILGHQRIDDEEIENSVHVIVISLRNLDGKE